jgi:hypothetical protein
MSKSENRHYTLKWKKKRFNHSGDKCSLSKCPICHPHKAIGGNHKSRTKPKYRQAQKWNE